MWCYEVLCGWCYVVQCGYGMLQGLDCITPSFLSDPSPLINQSLVPLPPLDHPLLNCIAINSHEMLSGSECQLPYPAHHG
jgi:hypothetical protein